MTTIVYDHENQQVAVDSRGAKSSGLYNDCFNKIVFEKALTFILCGSVCDFEFFASNFEKYKKVGLDDIEIDCSGIMIRNGDPYYVFIHDGVFNEEPLSCNEAFGSGGNFALAAMDFGKSAKEAIEYAATKDMQTGGKVRVIDVETMKIK